MHDHLFTLPPFHMSYLILPLARTNLHEVQFVFILIYLVCISVLEFFRSELISGTLNPWWESFDLSGCPGCCSSSSRLALRVWVQEGDDHPRVHLEYVLDLRILRRVTHKVNTHYMCMYISAGLCNNFCYSCRTSSNVAVQSRFLLAQ